MVETTAGDTAGRLAELGRLRLLEGLADRDLRAIEAICELSVLERGERVYSTGDPADTVHLVVSGAVKIFRVAEEGKAVGMALLGPSEIFGALALSDESVRADTAEVVDDALVCSFERRAFEEFLASRPTVALRVMRLVGDRLRRTETKIEDILCHDVRTRLAHTLGRLAEAFGDGGDGGDGTVRIAVRLTQSELAQLIGSTRETTSTIFNEFRRDGLVDTEDGRIVVHDVDRLAGWTG